MASLLDESARGVFVIAATPFEESGAIDWRSLDTLIEFYLERGVQGLTILGMMGEAQKLSEVEAVRLVRHVLGRALDRVPVIVGVSNPGLDNLVALGRLAMDAGAAGVMVAPLAGLRSETQVLGYFAQVMDRLGDGIPVVYQDYPQATGSHISADGLLRLFDGQQSLAMLKHEDCPGLAKLSALRRAWDGRARRRVPILCGNGGLYLAQELRRGADGAMTGFAFPEMLVGVCDLFRRGRAEEAEDLYDAYLPLIRYEQQPGIGLAIRKEILRRRGAIRSAAVRAPGPRLEGDDLRELDRLLARLERSLAGASAAAAE